MSDGANEKILIEIANELTYQETRWGTAADDTLNAPNDWVAYISHYATRWFSGGYAPYQGITIDAFRTSMIKVAALAVAAIKSLDRQRDKHGAAFYEVSDK